MTTKRVLRIDSAGSLRKPIKMPNGWLRVDGYLTRTGVFTYRNSDGSPRRELRLPEDVFHQDSLDTFAMVPVTDDHPPVFLDSENTSEYQRGHVGEVVSREGKMMRATMLITDKALVEKIEKGKAVEISNGYSCDLDETPGVTADGERYDAIQRNIRANHAAIVTAGRAGSEARVRMDAAAGVMVSISDADASRSAKPAVPPGVRNVEKIKVDGVEYEVGSAQLAAAQLAFQQKLDKRQDEMPEFIKKAIAKKKAKAKGGDEGDEEDDEEDDDEEVVDAKPKSKKKDSALASEVEAQRARADAAIETQAKLEKELKAAPAKIAAEIKARMNLEAGARTVLGRKINLDAMDDRTIKLAVLRKTNPELVLEKKSDSYVDARFDIAIETAEAEAKEDGEEGIDQARGGSHEDSEEDPGDPGVEMTAEEANGKHTDSLTAYDAMCQRSRTEWLKPIGGERAAH